MCPCVRACVRAFVRACVRVSFQAYTRRRLWSDRDQILHTHADSHRKGSGKTKNLPCVTQGGIWGVLGGQKCKSQENLPSGCTDWHQICYTSADSSWNRHRLKTISSSIPQGAFWGVLRGHKMQQSGKSTKWLDRLSTTLVHVCGFIWEWS